MMHLKTSLLATILYLVPVFSCAAASIDDQVQIVEIATRAMKLEESQLEKFLSLEKDFTVEGWHQYRDYYAKSLKADGSPNFSQEFTPSGSTDLIDDQNGIVHLRIAGKLTQSKLGGSLNHTYETSVLDVKANLNPIKIQCLKPVLVEQK